MVKKMGFKSRRIFNYLILGFFTTLINVSIYSFLVMINTNYMISNLIAFCVSVLFAYVTNRKWVFNPSSEKEVDTEELIKFFLARVTTLTMESAILYVCINLLIVNQYIVKIIANIIVIVTNYKLSEYIVFRRKKSIKEV